MKKLKTLLKLGIIFFLIVLGLNFIPKFKVEENKQTLSSNIEENIENIIEITSVKYNYTNLAEYDNSLEINGFTIPFTNKTFLVKYSGYLKAGFTDLDIEVEDKKAIVKLGEMKVLDNVINEEDVYFYNEKDSVFNKLNFDELYDLLKDEKLKVEKEAVEKGFLTDSEREARKIISSFLETLGFEEVVFK